LGDASSAAALVATAIGWVGVSAFFSLWIHRARGNRALTMGLYIVFGALAWFGFLYGLGSNYRDYREEQGFFHETTTIYMLAGIASGLVLIPPTRKLLARLIPFDPASWPDIVGLIIMLTAGFVGLATTFFKSEVQDAPTYLDLANQAVLMVVLAAFGVGLYVKRTPRETLQRLGLVRPTLRQVGIAIALVLVAFAVAIASAELLKWLQPDIYDRVQDNADVITSNINSVWGAILLGLTAGIGEELLFRGALQPRFGIIFTSLIFALLHVQYDASLVTVGIFAAGIIFGLERKKMNTTSCIITHALYNTIAVLLSM
jgi:membrane protease YdiL (CAAX protease family)